MRTEASPRSINPQEAGRGRMLFLICAGVICAMTPWFSATAILPELRETWAMSSTLSAMLTNAVQAGFVIGALAISLSNLADIFSPVTLMKYGAAAAGLLTGAVILAPGAEVAAVLRFGTGVALAFVYPPAMKLTTTWFVRGRGLALGCVIGGLTLGSAMPHLLRGAGGRLDWQLVMLAAAVVSLMGAVIFFTLREGPYAYGKASFSLSQIGQVFTNRGVSLANLGYFGHMWELYAMWAWILVYSQQALLAGGLSLSPASVSLIVFAVIATGVAGAVGGGLLADRYGRTLTTAGMMLTSAACALAIGFAWAGPVWLFVLIALIWGASVIGDSAQFSAMVTEIADSHLVGTALTVQMGIGFLITMVSIQILPLFADWLGSWQWSFLALAPGPLIGAAAVLRLRRLPEARRLALGKL